MKNMRTIILVVAILLAGGILFYAFKYNWQAGHTGAYTGQKSVVETGTANQQTPADVTASGARNFDATNQITLNVTEPANNATVKTATITVSGTTVPDADVFVDDRQLKADIQGKFSATIQLDVGSNTIIVVANDSFGNSSEKDIVVNYDNGQTYQ